MTFATLEVLTTFCHTEEEVEIGNGINERRKRVNSKETDLDRLEEKW